MAAAAGLSLNVMKAGAFIKLMNRDGAESFSCRSPPACTRGGDCARSRSFPAVHFRQLKNVRASHQYARGSGCSADIVTVD